MAAPVAEITATPASGESPLLVSFDASRSTGVNPVYEWDFGDGSAKETGAKVEHSYTVDKKKTFTVTLTVKDASGEDEATTVISVDPAAPELVVDAGTDLTVEEGKSAILEASASGGTGELKYRWTLVTGDSNAGSLSSATVLRPTFRAKAVDVETVLEYRLTVTDSAATPVSQSDTVTITVKPVAGPLVVDAGTDLTVNEGESVELKASASGGTGELKYQWTLITGDSNAGSLSSATVLRPTFRAKAVDVETVLEYRLTVTDSAATPVSQSDTVTITVKPVAGPLVVDAGTDLTVNEGESVELKASASGGTGELKYRWTLVTGDSNAGSLSSATVLNPEFRAGSVTTDTILEYRLTVTDSAPEPVSKSDTVKVTIKNVPKKPTANPGRNRTVGEGEKVRLDGSQSTDPDGRVVEYVWKSLDEPPVALANAATATPEFTAPRVGLAGRKLRFSLQVEDDDGLQSDPAEVVITVENSMNDAPNAVIDAAIDSVKPGETFTLDGSASTDPDGKETIKTYQWRQKADDPLQVTIVKGDAAVGEFKAPAISETVQLTLILTVTDEEGKSDTAQTAVVVTLNENLKKPVADAGEDDIAESGRVVTLSGGKSHDQNPDGSIVGYRWRQLSGPEVSLKNADKVDASFIAPNEVTKLEFELKVIDNDSLFAIDTVSVFVGPTGSLQVDAGEDQIDIEEGSTVTLSGVVLNGSGGEQKLRWRQVDTTGSHAVLSDVAEANVFFVTPPVTGGKDAMTLTFELVSWDSLKGVGIDRVDVTIQDNGIVTVPDAFVPIRPETDDEVAVGFDIQSGNLVRLRVLKAPSNERATQKNRPKHIPYGMFDFTLKVDKPGDSVTLRVWFPEDVGSGYDWFKYDAATKTWTSHPNAAFNGSIMMLTLTDGGEGDDDGKKNGMIYDPAGLGSRIADSKVQVTGESGGGSGSAGFLLILGLCFVSLRFVAAQPESKRIQ